MQISKALYWTKYKYNAFSSWSAIKSIEKMQKRLRAIAQVLSQIKSEVPLRKKKRSSIIIWKRVISKEYAVYWEKIEFKHLFSCWTCKYPVVSASNTSSSKEWFCAISSQVKKQWIELNLNRYSCKHYTGSFLSDCSFLKIIAKSKISSECKQVEVSTTDSFAGFLIKVRWFVLLVTSF